MKIICLMEYRVVTSITRSVSSSIRVEPLSRVQHGITPTAVCFSTEQVTAPSHFTQESEGENDFARKCLGKYLNAALVLES